MQKATTLLIAIYAFLIVPITVTYFLPQKINEEDVGSMALPVLWSIFLLFLCVTAGFNIWNAIKLLKAGDYNRLRHEMGKVKLGSIPFFIGNFAILLCAALFLGVVATAFFWTIAAPIIFIIWLSIVIMVSYAITPISSIYGVTFILLLKKEREIGLGAGIGYILMQICPVLDVVSTIILLAKHKKRIN